MRKIIKIESSHPKLLKIYYDLSNVCNYKCWYCFPDFNSGDKPWPDVEVVKKSLVALVNHYRTSNLVDDIELILLGGEPTLWSKLTELTQHLLDNCNVKVVLLTNGSRTLRWWEEHSHHFFNINISVHHESAKIDHIVKLGELLYDKDAVFNTNVLMDHKNWDKCMANYDRIMATEKKWPVIVKPLYIDGVFDYTPEQMKFLETTLKRMPEDRMMHRYEDDVAVKNYTAFFSDDTTFKTSNPNWFGLNLHNRFKGWECNVGIEILFINNQGTVHSSCGQMLYGATENFNLFDPEFADKFKPIIAPVICTLPVCGSCTGNTSATKRKLD